MKKEEKLKTKWCVLKSYDYKNGSFRAGFVKDSPHTNNDFFLQMHDLVFDLTYDEVYAIIAALSEVLWLKTWHNRMNKKDQKKFKWIDYKTIIKNNGEVEIK